MRWEPLWQLTLVKLRDLWREPEAMFWVFVFPVLMALALGIAFREQAAEPIAVGVQRGAGDAEVHDALARDPGMRPRLLDAEEARQELRTGKLAIVVVPGDPWTYWFDPTRPDSRLARLAVNDVLQRSAGGGDVRRVTTREMTEKGSRYIDFLIPGLLGINLMGTGMWGIGFYVVNSRARHLLQRFLATPMRRSHFLLSQIGGRLAFLAFEVGTLLLFARLVFGVPMRGSFLALATVTLTGALCFSGLGLLVAARPRTVEGVSGLINLVMMPMWLFSGTFFSTARFPDLAQPWIRALPLTAVNDALRAVMLDGAALAAVSRELLVISLWGVLSFAVALRLFRWR